VNKAKLQRYTAPNSKGIGDVMMEDPAAIRCLQSTNYVRLFLDLLCMSGSWLFLKIQTGVDIWS